MLKRNIVTTFIEFAFNYPDCSYDQQRIFANGQEKKKYHV